MNGDFAVDEKDHRNLQKPGGNPPARSFTQYRIVSRSSELEVGPSSGSKFSAIDFFECLRASCAGECFWRFCSDSGAVEYSWRYTGQMASARRGCELARKF
jgi:hypothetical protein